MGFGIPLQAVGYQIYLCNIDLIVAEVFGSSIGVRFIAKVSVYLHAYFQSHLSSGCLAFWSARAGFARCRDCLLAWFPLTCVSEFGIGSSARQISAISWSAK